MRWLFGMTVLAASSIFLYRHYLREATPSPALSAPPPMVVIRETAFLGQQELERIRESARQPNPSVRWTAIELLCTLGDPQAMPLLEKALAEEPDPDNRKLGIRLLEKRADLASVQAMVRSLQDADKSVRLAALKAIANNGEPSAIPWVALAASKDYEPEVRSEALRVLGKFQDKRTADFAALAARLRRDYEDAVERAAKKQQQEEH